MSDRVHLPVRLAKAALVLALVFVASVAFDLPVGCADMIQTIDGKWQPLPLDPRDESKKTMLPPPSGDDDPTNEYLVDSEDARVDATYETVKSTKGFNKSAAYVKRILSTERARNANFVKALNDASQKVWDEAAESFRAAAAEVSGFAKQEALWLAVQARTETGDVGQVTTAIDELLSAFPKTFFFAEAHVIRAKIAAQKNDAAGITVALDAVKNAAGMNIRDLLRAEYTRVNLTLELQKKYDEAAAAYRVLVERADKEKDGTIVATTRQQCLVGLGNCLLATKKSAEAKGHFDRASESRDADVLAGAYAGLGDVAFVDAKALRDGGKADDAKKRLEEAILHYLRVTELYRADVTNISPVLSSMQNAAKVFTVLFEMSGNKDCELADRACKQYHALFHMLDAGAAERRSVKREYDDIAKRRDDCKAKAK